MNPGAEQHELKPSSAHQGYEDLLPAGSKLSPRSTNKHRQNGLKHHSQHTHAAADQALTRQSLRVSNTSSDETLSKWMYLPLSPYLPVRQGAPATHQMHCAHPPTTGAQKGFILPTLLHRDTTQSTQQKRSQGDLPSSHLSAEVSSCTAVCHEQSSHSHMQQPQHAGPGSGSPKLQWCAG